MGEVLLHHPCTKRDRMAIRQEDAAGRGPLAHAFQRARRGQDVQHHVVHGETVVRQFDRRRRHVGKRHRAVPLERRQPGINGRGQDAAVDPAPNTATLFALEEVDRGRLWPPAEPADGLDRATVGQIHHERCHAADVGQVRLRHVDTESRGDTGVHGVPARFEDAVSSGSGQIMAGGHHVARAHDDGSGGAGPILASHVSLLSIGAGGAWVMREVTVLDGAEQRLFEFGDHLLGE